MAPVSAVGAQAEIVNRLKTVKYGNREILLDLMNAGVLPKIGSFPHLAGWEIVEEADDFRIWDYSFFLKNGVSIGVGGVYAIHKRNAIKKLLPVEAGFIERIQGTSKFLRQVKYDYSKSEEKEITSFSASCKCTRKYEFRFSDQGVDDGLSDLLKISFEGICDSKYNIMENKYIVTQSMNMKKVSGRGQYYDDAYEIPAVIEGSVKCLNGKRDPTVYINAD